MSKKTRSQKIIADLRRKIKLSQQDTEHTETPPSVKEEKTNNYQYQFLKNRDTKISESQIKKTDSDKSAKDSRSELISPELTAYIKKDLFKTFFLSGLVIFSIILLYWSFELGGQNFLVSLLPKKLF